MARLIILLLLVLPLFACAHSNATKSGDGLRASYVWGPEVNTMKPCGSDSTFWVLASPEIIGRLRAAQYRLQTKPYDQLFIRVLGQRSTRKTDGFAEDTDGYFEVTELLEVRQLQQAECT